jgi:hypothetical protein
MRITFELLKLKFQDLSISASRLRQGMRAILWFFVTPEIDVGVLKSIPQESRQGKLITPDFSQH